jgi:hypothetical protein
MSGDFSVPANVILLFGRFSAFYQLYAAACHSHFFKFLLSYFFGLANKKMPNPHEDPLL